MAIARSRAGDLGNCRFEIGDAERLVGQHGPFDLLLSRHGVMFFDDPVRAFRALRSAAETGAPLVFSCFRDWSDNPWGSDLAEAVAGAPVDPGSPFAFADERFVRKLLADAGWTRVSGERVDADYIAGEGADPVADALDFLTVIGPAARQLRELPDDAQPAGRARMRQVLERFVTDGRVRFPAAAWVWSARAG